VIPIGTVLSPRDTEADFYNVAPVEFGVCSVFKLDYDGITAAYICDEYKVQIEHKTEQELWNEFSTEKFNVALHANKRPLDAPPLLTPEEQFAKVASEEAAE
jgi:hypothetical protein